MQDSIYPENFIKMRCVENHDQPRLHKITGSKHKTLAWTAFMAFNKGPFFIYAGQESAATHTPSLFDIDKVEWGSYEFSEVLSTTGRAEKRTRAGAWHPDLPGS